MEAVATRRAVGLYHAGGPERLSRAEFGRVFAQIFGLDPDRVIERKAAETPLDTYRPPDLSLNSDLARRELGYAPKNARNALARLFEQIQTAEAL